MWFKRKSYFRLALNTASLLVLSVIYHGNAIAQSDEDPECRLAIKALSTAQKEEDKQTKNLEKENSKLLKAQATASKKIKSLQDKKQAELDKVRGLSILCKKDFPSLFKAVSLTRPKSCADLLRPTIAKIKKIDADILAANTDFQKTKSQITLAINRAKKLLSSAVKKRKAAEMEVEDLGCEID